MVLSSPDTIREGEALLVKRVPSFVPSSEDCSDNGRLQPKLAGSTIIYGRQVNQWSPQNRTGGKQIHKQGNALLCPKVFHQCLTVSPGTA